MENRKSYLVVSKFTYEYETDLCFKLFHKEDNAKKYFKKVVESEKGDGWIADSIGDKDFVMEETDKHFEAYQEGWAAQTSTEVWITELEYADAE